MKRRNCLKLMRHLNRMGYLIVLKALVALNLMMLYSHWITLYKMSTNEIFESKTPHLYGDKFSIKSPKYSRMLRKISKMQKMFAIAMHKKLRINFHVRNHLHSCVIYLTFIFNPMHK